MFRSIKNDLEAIARAIAARRAQSEQRPARAEPLPFNVEWCQRFLGHQFKLPPSALHRDLAADLGEMHLRRGQRRCYRAPRGAAKTTWISVAYPLWCICEDIEPFILLTSSGGSIAKDFLKVIKAELEGNELLAKHYPHATGEGSEWTADNIVTRNGVRVAAKGSRMKVLGMRHKSRRPTLVIADDPNERQDAYSPTVRRRVIEWWDKSIMPIGEAGYTNFLVAGTSIHREALVCELSRRGTWQTRQYKSLASLPTNSKLWQEWELIAGNIADAGRQERAREFFAANRAEMSEGASVLWPDKFPLDFLMGERMSQGVAAFNSEYQDEPGADGATEWPSDYFDHADFWFVDDIDPHEVVASVQAMDPSKGGAGDKPGDYQAHVLLRITRDGVLWVDAELRREDSTAMIDTAAELSRRWRPDVLAFETNATMGLLQAEINRVHAAGLLGTEQVQAVHNSDPKFARIRRVGQYLARKQVRVRNNAGGRELVEQLRNFPTGEHDDGPDALATALRLLEMRLA